MHEHQELFRSKQKCLITRTPPLNCSQATFIVVFDYCGCGVLSQKRKSAAIFENPRVKCTCLLSAMF